MRLQNRLTFKPAKVKVGEIRTEEDLALDANDYRLEFELIAKSLPESNI